MTGRKGWLFSNTPKGAKSSAIIYSIIETAKENKLKPYDYMNYLLEQIPNVDFFYQSKHNSVQSQNRYNCCIRNFVSVNPFAS